MSTRKDKLDWLITHPDAIRDVPSDREDVTDENRPSLLALVGQMIDAKLYSRHAGSDSRNWALRRLVGEARRFLGEED